MVNTEISPRCSRVISASSDTPYLHFSTQRCAHLFIPASLQHDLQFASHLDREVPIKLLPSFQIADVRGATSRRPKARLARGLFPEMRQTPPDQFIGSRTFLRQQILRSEERC